MSQSKKKSFFAILDEKNSKLSLISALDGKIENTNETINEIDQKDMVSLEKFLNKHGKDSLNEKIWKISQAIFSILQWISKDKPRKQLIASLQDSKINDCKELIKTHKKLTS